jgi:hypothetical protein
VLAAAAVADTPTQTKICAKVNPVDREVAAQDQVVRVLATATLAPELPAIT